MKLPVIKISERGAQRLRSGHPWVYRSDVITVNGKKSGNVDAIPAGPVAVTSPRERLLGIADYSPASQIALRLLSGNPEQTIDTDWFRQRLAAALRYRATVVLDSDCYRVVWGEADGLPGLVVDRYASAIVIQTLTAAMNARQPELVALLDELLQPAAIVERNDAKVRRLEDLETRSGLLKGSATSVECTIAGVRFVVDLLEGQKTGAFLDQRENWLAVASYAAQLGQRCEALDAFTYQGGFALFLARHCARVEAADISHPALEHAERNGTLNRLHNIDWIEANAFDLLHEYEKQRRSFDVVVLDPPAFAKRRVALDAAERGYKEINLRALKLLREGGLLVSCSCSHHVSEASLLQIIADAALDAHRRVFVVERRTQSRDHPILLTVPETHYLKCIILRVW